MALKRENNPIFNTITEACEGSRDVLYAELENLSRVYWEQSKALTSMSFKRRSEQIEAMDRLGRLAAAIKATHDAIGVELREVLVMTHTVESLGLNRELMFPNWTESVLRGYPLTCDECPYAAQDRVAMRRFIRKHYPSLSLAVRYMGTEELSEIVDEILEIKGESFS